MLDHDLYCNNRTCIFTLSRVWCNNAPVNGRSNDNITSDRLCSNGNYRFTDCAKKLTSKHKEIPYDQSAVGSAVFSVLVYVAVVWRDCTWRKDCHAILSFVLLIHSAVLHTIFLWILDRIKCPLHLRYMLTGTVSSEYKQKTQQNSSKLHVPQKNNHHQELGTVLPRKRIPQLYPTEL